MNLENILSQKKDKKKSSKVSRAAEGLIKAHQESSILTQHFELLERMIEEATEIRKKIPNLKKFITYDNKDRSNLIEKAALELIQSSDESGLNKKNIEKLKQAISWGGDEIKGKNN